MNEQVGVVVIGRNENERLRRCLESLGLPETGPKSDAGLPSRVVYVDSGSTDHSVALALSMGATVVELDLTRPFTAARARNEGLSRLSQQVSKLPFVQFLDGDCAVAESWLETAYRFLDENPLYAVACGRRRERFPQATIYNRLCDMEWNTPIGEASACGGDAMMRVDALEEVGGFDPTVIAGEEPELCVRLRQKGWRIMRLDSEMTMHDAAMTHFGQWWRRAMRAGYAYALGCHMHGAAPEHHWVRETRRIWFWGILLPSTVLIFAWPTGGVSLLLLASYPALALRVHCHMLSRGISPTDSISYAFFCVLAKFPQAQGLLRFWWRRLWSQSSEIIEYKRYRSCTF